MPAREATRFSEQSGMRIKIHLATDACNLLSALGVVRLKTPTETSFFGHLFGLRQRLARGATD